MNQIAEDLERAVEILEARGWCKGAYLNPDGRVCAEGAVILAVGGTVDAYNKATFDTCELMDRAKACVDVLTAALPRMPDGSVSNRPDRYNDLDSTSVEDVKLMFKRAIERAQ